MWKGVVQLDEINTDFVWSGSLCKTMYNVLPNEEIFHSIECCMFAQNEYHFGVKIITINDRQSIWCKYPLNVQVK